MGWLRNFPIVSLLFAAAIAAVSFQLAHDPGEADLAGEAAREYFARHAQLEVDALGELILEPAWLIETRESAANFDATIDVQLPPRMIARSQARLDHLIEQAYQARMSADPAWRLGVLDGGSPQQNYIKHAFVHETTAGVLLSIVVLILIGVPLERTWGSWIFAAFVASAIPVVAHSYRLLDASSSGVPWSGGAGLAGALLGAYFIRSLGGQFGLPGWIVLPVWLGLETFLVRGFWLDDLGNVPWATLCAAVGFGALAASSLRLMKVEAHVDDRASKRKVRGPNPIVARAARMLSDGDPYQAFDLIQAAWRDTPTDADVCEAFYSIAVEVGQPEVAAEAILPALQTALKEGDIKRAIDYWLPLASKESEIALEPTVAVRLGEALLDAGHPQEALFSLRRALEAGVSSAHATRIANIARDLDVGLTQQAAAIALEDSGLDPRTRADLESLVVVPSADPPESAKAPIAGSSRSQLDRRVQAEHQVVEMTSFPLDVDSHLEPDFTGDLADLDADETALSDQPLDAHALSAESLAEDVAPAATSGGSGPVPEDSGDVLSHWNDQNAIAADTLTDVSAALDEELIAEALLDSDDLEAPGTGLEFRLAAAAPDPVDPRDEETDTDFTPLMEATDESTSPMARAASTDSATDVSQSKSDFAFGDTANQAIADPPLRTLKALEAVPINASGEWIEIDADGRGKSKLPYSRIQAISMAAVSGLGSRPVLVLDFVLNWVGASSEPMKLIRFRSDRFDPLEFSPGLTNPLAALTAWVVEIERRSGATCLPTREVLKGRFTRYASIEAYERKVLMATTDVTLRCA